MSKFNLKELLGENKYLFQKYYQKTRLRSAPKDKLKANKWPKSWKETYFKAYPRLDEILLPKPLLSSSFPLKKSLFTRRSRRDFSKLKMSLKILSSLIYHSAGMQGGLRDSAYRFYPSGGARYPLELYIISLNTELPKGIYHYYVRNHSLEKLLEIKKLEIRRAFTPHNQVWVKNSAVIILLTAILNRTSVKYGEKAYRFAHFEAGHLGQNLYLVSSALNLNCCAIGGINDDYFENLLDINNESEIIIYTLAVGKTK